MTTDTGETDGFDLIIQKLKQYKGIEYTELQAKNHVLKAKKSLDLFEPSKARDVMMMLADYSISRKV
ncbi:MAG: hypothetical protein HQK65_08945 [Desulfamplus sp.]|nr:hypothetical protein [Desulfamplus sp.]